jgi:hypothetical protein
MWTSNCFLRAFQLGTLGKNQKASAADAFGRSLKPSDNEMAPLGQ